MFVLEGSIDKFIDINYQISILNKTIHGQDEQLLVFSESIPKFSMTGLNEVTKSRCNNSVFISSSKKTYIGELLKKDYWNIFQNLSNLKRTDDLKLLHKLNFIEVNASDYFLESFSNHFQTKLLNHGDKLISQGEAIDNVYVVKKGTFELSYMTKSQFNHIFNMKFFNQFEGRFTETRRHEILGYKDTIEEHKV